MNKIISIRFNSGEHKRLIELQEKYGLSSKGATLKSLALTDKTEALSAQDAQTLSILALEAHKIGVNFNQLVKRVHSFSHATSAQQMPPFLNEAVINGVSSSLLDIKNALAVLIHKNSLADTEIVGNDIVDNDIMDTEIVDTENDL